MSCFAFFSALLWFCVSNKASVSQDVLSLLNREKAYQPLACQEALRCMLAPAAMKETSDEQSIDQWQSMSEIARDVQGILAKILDETLRPGARGGRESTC